MYMWYYTKRERVSVPRRRDGYTLIELAVVLAILLTLAAVAVPLLMRHRDDALEAARLENARLVAEAVNEYNAASHSPVTQEALRAADTREALGALLGGHAPHFANDDEVAHAVSRVSLAGGFAAVDTP
jgi:prepilin-type N-terminal cleavage/methylation domain-containing protein